MPPYLYDTLLISFIYMKRLSTILYFCLILLFFLLLEGPMSHIPYFHEQHHLFLFSRAYLESHLSYPGQLLDYLADFCIQLLYLPHAGKLFFAFLLSLPYLLNTLIVKKWTQKADTTQSGLVLPLYLLVQHESIDYPLTHLVGIDLCLLFFFLISLIRPVRWRYLLLLAVIFGAYLIGGWKYPTIALTYLSVSMGLALLTDRYLSQKVIRLSVTAISLLCYAGTTFYYFVNSYNMRERRILEAEIHLKAGEWEQVMESCQHYRGNNQLVLYFYNLALYHTGRMPHDLFEMPQVMGSQSLFLPWKSDSRQSEYGHYLYEQLGYINEAHRWEFEAMVVFGETAPHLLNLSRYNIANHRPKVAMKFIRKLKQSLFYRKQASELEQQALSGETEGLHALPHKENEPARFTNVFNITPELTYLCNRDSSHRMAFEYLMSDLLLSNRLVRFAENLNRIHAFSYPELPRIYEEALYIYRLGVDKETFEQCGFSIRPETEERFKRYYSLYQKGNQKELQQQFGNTYWYYLHHISPYGNKIIEK